MRAGIVEVVFGWPLFAMWNAWVFASAHHGWTQAYTFLTFVPVVAITTAIWAALLTAIWLVLRLALTSQICYEAL
jgi:hypothetical protein